MEEDGFGSKILTEVIIIAFKDINNDLKVD